MSKPILLVPTKVISVEDKKKLEKEGYIVIEVDDPTKIKTLNNVELMSGGDVFKSLVEATICTATGQAKFADALLSRIKINIKNDEQKQ